MRARPKRLRVSHLTANTSTEPRPTRLRRGEKRESPSDMGAVSVAPVEPDMERAIERMTA